MVKSGLIGGIFLVAAALRLVFVWQWRGLAYGLEPLLDAQAYHRWAISIASGDWAGGGVFYQSPLYPYLLAIIYKVSGPSPQIAAWVNAVVGSATCWVLAATAWRWYGALAGVATGLLAAFCRPLIFFSAPVLKEAFLVFLLALFAYFLLDASTRGRWRDAIAAGLLLGLAALARGNALLLAPVVPALCVRGLGWAAGVRISAVAGLATMAAVLPATLHNWAVSGDLVLINSCGGFNFYVGQSPSANGANFYPPFVTTDPAREEADARRVAEAKAGRPLTAGEVSRFWFGEGLSFATDNPVRAMELLAIKFRLFLNDHEVADNYDQEFIRANFPTVLGWPLVGFAWVAILAAVGLFATWKTAAASRALAALAGFYMISALVFYVTDRYRLPIYVFLLPLAGAGAQALADWLHARSWTRIAGAGLVSAPVAAFAFWTIPPELRVPDAYNWGMQASLWSDGGRDREALTAISRALASEPAQIGAQAYVKASTSLERLGDNEGAEKLLRLAVRYHPGDGLTYFNLGRFKQEHGDSAAAAALYEEASRVAPYLHQPYIGLGILYWEKNDRVRAGEAVSRGLRIQPASPELRQLAERLGIGP